MKRKITAIILMVALVLALAVGSGIALARGPAEKATGTVGGPDRGWYADFNAHEEMDGRPAKGSMHMWSDVVGRELDLNVQYVNVVGDDAWFAAVSTYDSAGTNVGKWFFIKVHDGGTPGTSGDEISWDWNSGTNEENAEARVLTMDTPAHWWAVTDGNLVVHTYD